MTYTLWIRQYHPLFQSLHSRVTIRLATGLSSILATMYDPLDSSSFTAVTPLWTLSESKTVPSDSIAITIWNPVMASISLYVPVAFASFDNSRNNKACHRPSAHPRKHYLYAFLWSSSWRIGFTPLPDGTPSLKYGHPSSSQKTGPRFRHLPLYPVPFQ